MTLQEHTDYIRRLRESAGENAITITDDLAALSSDYMVTLDTISNKEFEILSRDKTIEQLNADKELLQKTNNKLFLQVGVPSTTETQPTLPENTNEKRTFDSLFAAKK